MRASCATKKRFCLRVYDEVLGKLGLRKIPRFLLRHDD